MMALLAPGVVKTTSSCPWLQLIMCFPGGSRLLRSIQTEQCIRMMRQVCAGSLSSLSIEMSFPTQHLPELAALQQLFACTLEHRTLIRPTGSHAVRFFPL